jgi:hypothetical protein
MKYSIIYYIWVHCPISIIYGEFHSYHFMKNIWMRFFIQTNINVWIHKSLLKKHYHLKGNKNFVGIFVSKIHFMCYQNARGNEKNLPPKIIQNAPQKKKKFLPKMYQYNVLSPFMTMSFTSGKLGHDHHNCQNLAWWYACELYDKYKYKRSPINKISFQLLKGYWFLNFGKPWLHMKIGSLIVLEPWSLILKNGSKNHMLVGVISKNHPTLVSYECKPLLVLVGWGRLQMLHLHQLDFDWTTKDWT